MLGFIGEKLGVRHLYTGVYLKEICKGFIIERFI